MQQVNILIVEDDSDVAQVVQRMLEVSGYQPHVAHNGQTAQALIDTQTFDVAILDLNLGQDEISGIDLLAILRQQSPKTAVIMLSGYATLDSAIAAVRLGAHDYLLKPANVNQIRQSIEQALQKQNQHVTHTSLLNHMEEQLTNTLADMRQLLANAEDIATTTKPNVPDVLEKRFLELGTLIIDIDRQIAFYNEQPLDLTLMEYSLLVHLIRMAPRLATPQELVVETHGYDDQDYHTASNLIRPHISRLRHKLRAAGAGDMVRTVYGRGYTIAK